MKPTTARQSALATLMLASGCSGVPQLYKPATNASATTLAPKVEHIVDRITCELAGISKVQLKGKSYVITVLLTLQVNDDINLTPSLAFLEPLTVAATNRTFTQNLGIGGARERMFTSTFSFESDKLADLPVCDNNRGKLYRLDGNLGLFEIARDGMGITNHQLAGGRAPPAPPSFASQVKFVVTRSVGALGPTWTLLSFKGPGGANGLLNGKALSTDSVNVAFAVKKEKGLTDFEQRQIDLWTAILRTLVDRENEANKAVNRQTEAVDRLRRAFSGGARLANAESTLTQLKSQRDQSTADRIRAQDDLEAARRAASTEADARSRADAINTGQNLIQTMILQNLNVQPR